MLSKAGFILSRKKVIKQYDILKDISDTISYSYKTNFEIAQVLKENTGCMFSIHSIESLNNLSCPERTWFFAQAWEKDEINGIFCKGVRNFVVDNLNDLGLLISYIKENNISIGLLLRMKFKENTIHTGKHFVFGMNSKEVNRLIPELKDNKNITGLGIHFHRKTQNVSEWSILEELADSVSDENLKKLDYVNIGGGLPAEYKNFRKEIMVGIFEKIRCLKGWLNKKGISLIIEPGRFIAASPVKLEAHIMNIYDHNIVIDCSVFNAAMDTFVAHIRLLVEEEDENGERYTIKGNTPDSMDIFRYSVYLKDPKVGDKITFLNAGAYNYTTNFCHLPKLKTKIVE